ncbi:hypothetical protein ACIQAC_11945 [Streptomyces sp. NPDC088387]|uniref:hypothetical protein n=1 Tax=Streptomyces sp. NPDC088387 TaxID=3365859 RepID=UPI0037F75B20
MTGAHLLDEDGGIDWEATIRNCGLEVTGLPPISEAMDPTAALLVATSGNARPAVTVPGRGADALHVLDAHWKEQAAPLFAGGGGEFLVMLWGPGSSRVGWFRVREHTARAGLPSRVHQAVGKAEFVCLSVDGSFLCAVTDEADEYWIVTRRFE